MADQGGRGGSRRPLLMTGRRRFGSDNVLQGLAVGSAVLILLMLAALVGVLGYSAIPSIRTFGWEFLVSTEWRPNSLEVPRLGEDGLVTIVEGEIVTETLPPVFGALPVIYGTVVSSLIALVFAVPLSMGAALFLVRLSSRTFAAPVSFLIEFLAAIPSIAYGIWGLFVLAPFLQLNVEPGIRWLLHGLPGTDWMFYDAAGREIPLTGLDLFCGGLILGIMILPIITALSRDVLRAVPREQIEGTVALGATWWQSSKEMLRYGRAGLFGAVMLGMARAAGETMAVTMVIGNNNQIQPSPFAAAQTMASLLASEFPEAGELHQAALIQVALILLVMSLMINIGARYLIIGRSVGTGGAQ
jgi:phosphate transport system permease protein